MTSSVTSARRLHHIHDRDVSRVWRTSSRLYRITIPSSDLVLWIASWMTSQQWRHLISACDTWQVRSYRRPSLLIQFDFLNFFSTRHLTRCRWPVIIYGGTVYHTTRIDRSSSMGVQPIIPHAFRRFRQIWISLVRPIKIGRIHVLDVIELTSTVSCLSRLPEFIELSPVSIVRS